MPNSGVRGAPRRGLAVAAVVLWHTLAAAPAAHAADAYGPVSRTETLWGIARKIAQQEGSGSTAQMAWALYRANPGAFDGSPGRLRPGVRLVVPDAAAVRATPATQARALLDGTAATTASPPVAPAAPVIAQAVLQPAVDGEPHQWLILSGSGFAPGAVLELRDGAGRAQPPTRPQSVRAGRIDYAGVFPREPGRWQAVVRNADGARSAPQPFEVGTIAVAAAVPVPQPRAASGFAGSADQQALLAQARAGASTAERYQWLAALEPQYAGDVDFDYPFGTLALDTGRFSEAVFVLQRAVATRPKFAGARMELARAYYALGDNESARREFTTLQAQNPPPAARRAIAQYLEAIDRRAVSYESQRGVFAEVVSGYDSNANGAPDIQNFIGFTLDSRNQSTASGYYGVGLGGALSHPFAPAWRVLGQGAASYRANPDASFVDSQVLRAGGGLEWRPNRWTVALLPNGAYAMLDGAENHQLLAADGSAAYAFDDAQLALNVRYAQQRYVEALALQDIDTLLYGLSTQVRLRALPRVLLTGAATAGGDEAVSPGSPFGRDLLGLRVGATVDLGAGSAVTITAASLASDYDGLFFTLQPRTDEQLSGAVAFESGLWREAGWRLRLQASYVDNASTVALYDYDRIDAGLSVRKEFK